MRHGRRQGHARADLLAAGQIDRDGAAGGQGIVSGGSVVTAPITHPAICTQTAPVCTAAKYTPAPYKWRGMLPRVVRAAYLGIASYRAPAVGERHAFYWRGCSYSCVWTRCFAVPKRSQKCPGELGKVASLPGRKVCPMGSGCCGGAAQRASGIAYTCRDRAADALWCRPRRRK